MIPKESITSNSTEMNRLFLAAASALCIAFTAAAAPKESRDDIPLVKAVADGVIHSADTAKYMDWHYSTGILDQAMMRLYRLTGDERYKDYAIRHIDYCLAHYNDYPSSSSRLHFLRKFRELDHMGAECAGMMEVLADAPDKKAGYDAYIERAADHIRNHQERFPDGTLVRSWPRKMTLWGDDLYMGLCFMTRYAVTRSDVKMKEDAIRQVRNFNDYLWDDRAALYWHAYYGDLQETGGSHWGRCNGWIMLATCDLLDILDPASSEFTEILGYFKRQVRGVIQWQDGNGMWHQLLDRPDSYAESSCTAIFVYCLSHAVHRGWLDSIYMEPARRGWDALVNGEIDPAIGLKDVCIGTGIGKDTAHYYNRKKVDGETHGIGLLLFAGMEMAFPTK